MDMSRLGRKPEIQNREMENTKTIQTQIHTIRIFVYFTAGNTKTYVLPQIQQTTYNNTTNCTFCPTKHKQIQTNTCRLHKTPLYDYTYKKCCIVPQEIPKKCKQLTLCVVSVCILYFPAYLKTSPFCPDMSNARQY